MLLDVEIIEIGELGASFLGESGRFFFGLGFDFVVGFVVEGFVDWGVFDFSVGMLWGWSAFFHVGVNDFEVVASVILGAKSTEQGAERLSGSTTFANYAADILWVDGEG